MTFRSAPLPRPLDTAEAFFWLLDRYSSMNFAVIAEGTGPLATDALAAALPLLQARHPLLAVGIAPLADNTLQFFPAGAPAGLHEATAGADEWRSRLARDIVRPFVPGEAPLFRAHLYRLPDERWVLALSFHHSIGDARSGFTVLRELLSVASGCRNELQPLQPRPSLMRLYPQAYSGEAGMREAEALKAIKRDEAKRVGFPENVPGYREVRELDAPDILSLSYSPAETEAIAAAAKTRGATVHGAIGAAQLLAVRSLYPAGEEKPITLTTPADLRSTLAPPMDVETPGFYVTLLHPTFRVGPTTDFWSLAGEVAERTRQHRARGDGHFLYHFIPPTNSVPLDETGVVAFNEAINRRAPQTALLSNAGIIPPIETGGAVEVVALSFSLCPTPKQIFFASATTYAGRLTLDFMYDSVRLPAAAMRQVRDEMDARLRRNAL